MISERRHTILGLIIEHYLQTGEPIGSKTLCQLIPYPVSSATVRNEMAYLSQMGFLEQRHTSGGRVPSKASYRYYVDSLMQESPISQYEASQISERLSVNAGDPERLCRMRQGFFVNIHTVLRFTVCPRTLTTAWAVLT